MPFAPCPPRSRYFDPSRFEAALAVALRLATAVVLGIGGYGTAPETTPPAHAQKSLDPLSVQGEPCFTGMNPNGVTPILVTLINAGPGIDTASVVVRSESGSGSSHRYEYGPISLPSGSVKQLVAYPALESYTQGVTISLVGRFRTRQTPVLGLMRGGGGDGRQIGYIGDRVGGLASVRSLKETGGGPGLGMPQPGMGTVGQAEKSPLNDCYAKPEAAPDRASGYNGLSSLVIGDGAERLSANQWAAIRQWTLGGGALIFTGGASAPQTHVAEAAPLVPVTNLQGASVASLDLHGVGNGALPSGAIALTTGALRAGAYAVTQDGGRVVIAKMPVGAGSSTFLAFNPFEKPLRGWSGQVGLWQGVIRASAPPLNQAELRRVIQSREAFSDNPYGTVSPPGPTGSARANPFRVQLPPTSVIIYLFLAYFILVVPVSYFVLKRLRRMEWAWFTSPVLAAVFAYGFYLFTAELYKAGLSQRTAGLVIADARLNGDARFVGFTEMFFPRGGVYQIRIPGCELLEQSDVQQDYYYGSSGGAQMTVLETTDDGTEAVAPDFGVGNLAFRRLYHAEPVSWGRGLRADIRRGNASARGTAKAYTGKITNGTRQTLKGASLVLPSTAGTEYAERNGGRSAIPDVFDFVQLGDIAPGETKTIGAVLNSSRGEGQSAARKSGALAIMYQALAQGRGGRNADDGGGALLLAQTSGAPFGPPALGKSVGGDQSVIAVVAVPVR